MSTTPIASAHVCTHTAPPSNWVGNIVPGTRCQDGTAEHWDDSHLAGFFQYVDAEERTMGTATRHSHLEPKSWGRWSIVLDQFVNGRRWATHTYGVTDDFGWLVEVPA